LTAVKPSDFFGARTVQGTGAVLFAVAVSWFAPQGAIAAGPVYGPIDSSTAVRAVPDALWSGESGRVRAVVATAGRQAFDLVLGLYPGPVPPLPLHFQLPGVHELAACAPDGMPFQLLALLPFDAKRGTRLGAYRLGRWPQETGTSLTGYAPPDGFIEVTRESQYALVSTRFRLGDFLTHDQADVWPKYLVLRLPLVDKLELVADALERAGRPSAVRIMSGFRTPQYNRKGVGARGGRAADSRHIYGDASDIFVDADGDDRMDDLDRDGRVTLADAQWLAALVDSVETRHPDLVGGLAAYPATADHGPFVHTDVRGRAARW
jgi:hypothetical protein